MKIKIDTNTYFHLINYSFYKITVFAILIFPCTLLSGQNKLDYLEEFISDPGLIHAGIGIHITDKNNHDLISHNPNLNLIPASTLKVLTSLAALEFMSADYTYTTQVSLSSEAEADGTLRGDLTLTSSGDPSLASIFIDTYSLESLCEQIYQALVQANVQCIDGSIVIQTDPPARPPIADTWLWQDVGNYYAGGAYGFNIIDNSYDLLFDVSGSQGSSPSILSIRPEIEGLTFDNKVKIGPPKSGDQSYIYGGPNQLSKVVRGSLPKRNKSYKIKGAIPNPSQFFINYLYKYLLRKNIPIHGAKIDPTEQEKTPQKLLTIESPKLSELLEVVNEKSVNLYAEAILNTCMDHLQLNSAQKIIDSLLAKWELTSSGSMIQDGSGLSPRNSINCKMMTNILYSARDRLWMDVFIGSLAEGGQEGTLKNIFKSRNNIKIYAKSGSMSSVRAYTGYFFNDKQYGGSFCIIVNNYTLSDRTLKQKIDRLIMSVID